jgi:hypothetical protein
MTVSERGVLWFNDPNEILKHTNDLNSLHYLINARALAAHVGRANNETRLSEFIIRGSWVLDQFGQVGTIQADSVRRGKDSNYERIDLAPLRRENKVQAKDEFNAFIAGGNYSYSASGSRDIPYEDTPCQHCGKHFTMEDAAFAVTQKEERLLPLTEFVGRKLKDVVDDYPRQEGKKWMIDYSIPIRNDQWVDLTPVDRYGRMEPANKGGWAQRKGTIVTPPFPVEIDYDTHVIQPGDEAGFSTFSFYHANCLVAKNTEEFINSVAIAFDLAGVECNGMLPIPNSYGSESYRGQWLLIHTLKHGYFKVGWRKRVLMFYPVKVESQQDRGVVFYGNGIERHFNNYKQFSAHLKSSYNVTTTRRIGVSLAKEVTVGDKKTGLHTWIGFTCLAIPTAIEELLTEHLGYDFAYDATSEITIGEPIPVKDWPKGWNEAHQLMVGGKVVGRVNTSKLD